MAFGKNKTDEHGNEYKTKKSAAATELSYRVAMIELMETLISEQKRTNELLCAMHTGGAVD